MKKSMIILGSVVGAGVVGGGVALAVLVTRPDKVDPQTPTVNMSAGDVALLTKGATRSTETITVPNFAPVIVSNKDNQQDFAKIVKANKNGKMMLTIGYNDALIACEFKLKETASGNNKVIKVIVNKVFINTFDGDTLSDANIKGPNIAAFKAYARKYIYALWKLQSDKNPTDSLADIQAAIAANNPADLDSSTTE